MRENARIAGFPRGEVLRALEENLWELWSHFGLGPGCNLYDEDEALWFDTPIPTLPYNAVLRFVVRDNPDQRIDALVEHYRSRGVPFLWFVHPSSQPSDVGDRLRQRGLKEGEVVPGMAANLADLPAPSPIPDGYEIREVNESSVSEWYEIVAWRWNVPPEARPHLVALNQEFQIGTPSAKVRCWLVWHDGVPVCKGVVHCAAGAAGLYGVATKPEARKLGLARAVAIEALRCAYEDGYEMGILHSSPMAVSLYAKLGFHHVESFRIFASQDIHI